MFGFRIFQQGKSTWFPFPAPTLTLGRSVENDLVLDAEGVPDLAFRLVHQGHGITVSAVYPEVKPNINGRAAASLAMHPGDRLEIGPFGLILDQGPAAAAGTEPEGEPEGSANAEGTSRGRRSGIRGLEFQEGLARLCRMVAAERDMKALLEKIMRLLLEAFGGDDAFLFTLDGRGEPRVFVSTGPADASSVFSDTVVREVLRSGRGLTIGNALADPQYAQARSVLDLKLRAILCCPILTAGKPSGLIYLGSRQPAVAFGPGALRELEVYALVAEGLINHVEFIARQSQALAAAAAGGDFAGIIASSPAMKRVLDEVRLVSATNLAVLLQGETGTGKDVVANLIHTRSERRGKPFIVVNCGTMRGDVLASELFGHRKGAFTGAVQDHEGLFVAADGGTLFLDEIGEMELPLQAMLLRVLETGRVRPVGQSAEVQTELRLICATNRNLEEMVAEGTFRQDLFYRINQHLIHLPPLRERGEDIAMLAAHFLERGKALYPQKKIEGFHPDSLVAMGHYAWPGNVRELANSVHKAILFSPPPAVRLSLPESHNHWVGLEEALERFQSDYIAKALERFSGDKAKTAEALGIGKSTLFKYLAQASRPGAGKDQ